VIHVGRIYFGSQCGPTWVTWTPASSSGYGGNVPVDMTILRTTSGDGVSQLANFEPTFEAWTPCPNGWYVMDLDWSPVHAIAADIQSWARGEVTATDSKLVDWSFSVGLGGIFLEYRLTYVVDGFFIPGPTFHWNESWSINVRLSGVELYDSFTFDSGNGGSVAAVFAPYPGYEPPYSRLWRHRPVHLGGTSWPVTITSNFAATSYGTWYDPAFPPIESGIQGGSGVLVSSGDSVAEIASLAAFNPLDVVPFAGYFTGDAFASLGDLYT
jgi:hypothetical protein